MKPNYLNKFEDFLGIALVIILVFLLAIQVLFRYVFAHPLGWTEELARYAYIWMIFVGAVLATREREHVSVELIKTFLSEKAWQFCILFNDLCVLAFLFFLVPASFKYAIFGMNIDASGFGFSMFFVFVSLPFCGLLIGIHTIINMIKEFKQLTKKESDVVKTA